MPNGEQMAQDLEAVLAQGLAEPPDLPRAGDASVGNAADPLRRRSGSTRPKQGKIPPPPATSDDPTLPS